MPIQKDSNYTAPVFYPTEDYSIVKYLDISKFLSLLQKEQVFFCRLDKFEDKLEGSLPDVNIGYYKKWFKEIAGPAGLMKNEIDEYVKDRLDFSEKFKKLNCISCWNKNISESYALWKIYSDMNQGIMIKSSINRIIESFENSKEIIQISEVKYIDHSKDYIPAGNLNYPIIHKNIAYNYEQEVRLIHKVDMKNGLTHDWESEPNVNGRYIKTDLDKLIDEIVVSPYSPKWFYEIIMDIMNKYNLHKTISYSSIK